MYKAWIKAVGEKSWATNGLEFNTVQKAKNYANDLLSRWYGADKFAILPVSDKFVGFLEQDIIDREGLNE